MSGQQVPASQRRHVRRFVVAHVIAILSIYGLAVLAGGGFAAPPFPVDERVVARAAAEPRRPLATTAVGPTAPGDDGAGLVPQRSEIAPPWRFEADGSVRMREL
jgi:hypothetical protein